MSKEDAFVLSYGFQAILDRIKAKEETNQTNQERAQTILNRIERILDAPGSGNNRRQLKTMTAETNLVLQDTPLSSTTLAIFLRVSMDFIKVPTEPRKEK